MKKNKKDKEKFKRIEGEKYVDHSDEIKRLNRINGQVEGICKMLGENRKLGDVLAQCKAVHSALRSIESRILRNYLENVLDEVATLDKKKTREQKIEEIEELFKQAS